MTKRGSTALRTWLIPCSRHSAATSSARDASTRAATNRSIAGLPGDRPIGAGAVVVGHDHALEERPSRGDRDDRAADATGADDEDPHHEPASLQSIDPVKQWASFEQAP